MNNEIKDIIKDIYQKMHATSYKDIPLSMGLVDIKSCLAQQELSIDNDNECCDIDNTIQKYVKDVDYMIMLGLTIFGKDN